MFNKLKNIFTKSNAPKENHFDKLLSHSFDVRYCAAALTESTDDTSLYILLKDNDIRIRKLAITILPENSPLILFAVNDKDPEIRLAAAKKITNTNILYLVFLLYHEDKAIRDYADNRLLLYKTLNNKFYHNSSRVTSDMNDLIDFCRKVFIKSYDSIQNNNVNVVNDNIKTSSKVEDGKTITTTDRDFTVSITRK